MKILGSDFDGTLTQGGIGEEKCAAIRKWRESGNKFGIVSGRGCSSIAWIRKKFPGLEWDFFVAYNGGTILDSNGNILSETRCIDVSANAFVSDLLSWGCKFVHVDSDRYLCAVADLDDRPEKVAPEDTVLLCQMPVIKDFYQISILLPTVEDSTAMVECIRAAYGQWLSPLQNGKCIDIVPKGVNKARGLWRIMEMLHASHEDVIAVGDNINDTDMIREFRSYAMANGVKAIRDLADGIVSDVTEIIEKEM